MITRKVQTKSNQQLNLYLSSIFKTILILVISFLLSFNSNLKDNRLLESDVLVTILLTLLGISVATLSIFYALIPICYELIESKNTINKKKLKIILDSLTIELKHNIVAQLVSLAIVILFSLLEGVNVFYDFLKTHSLPIYNFLITNQSQITYFYKILALCISLAVVFDILIGISYLSNNED